MQGFLSPIGIYTRSSDTVNIGSNIFLYDRINNDNKQTFDVNYFDEYNMHNFNKIIKSGFMIFNMFEQFNNNISQNNDFVIFPKNKNTSNICITSMQLKSLRNSVNSLCDYQQLIINDFLLSAGLTPISEVFVSNECVKCVNTNSIIDKCKNCDVLKYNKKIKLIREFSDNKNDISNEDKILEYEKNGFSIINGECYDDNYYDKKYDFMRSRNELLDLDLVDDYKEVFF